MATQTRETLSLTQLHDCVGFYRAVWSAAKERGDEGQAKRAWELEAHFMERLCAAEYGRDAPAEIGLLEPDVDGLMAAAWAGDEWLVARAATYLRVSPRRVRQLITQGRLPARRLGRDLLVRRGDVEALAQSRRGPGRPPLKAKPRSDVGH